MADASAVERSVLGRYLADDASRTAGARQYHDLRKPDCKCKCHFMGCSFQRGQSCSNGDTHRIPLLSELAEAGLPAFLEWQSKLWKSAIAPLRDAEIERAAEREHELRES